MGTNPFNNDWQGKLIGRYQLEKLLGRGGMSEVWLATDTRLRRQVALKILPTTTDDQTYLQNFVYEARAAAALEHPHILGIHDFGEHQIAPGEVVPYLAMPYVSGGTLSDRMREATGPVPIQESLRYLRQAALAIDYAHSKRVLHRDIKPANMLLRDDWLLLTDFGIAKVLSTSIARGQTYAGSGTPEYMAPEQIMAQAIPASDRYSLAVVAYQLFTGRTPFQGETPSETISKQLQAPLPPAREFNQQIPPRVENLLAVALSRNPDLRPPSCIALVDALQQAWMSGVQTAPNPDATLLAPWSKRLQGAASSQSLAPMTGGTSSPSQPILSGGTSSPSLPVAQPGITPVLPISNGFPSQGSLASRTVTDPGTDPHTGGPVNDPFATASSHGYSTQIMSPTQPSRPKTLETKVGRRSILIGGIVAAAAVVGGGVAVLELLRKQPNSGQQGGPEPTPTPIPGPHNLISGVPILKLTGHTNYVWTASWDPSGRYLMTAGKDTNIMLWDITNTVSSASLGSSVATPKQQWSVGGIKFDNVTDGICWSSDGRKLIVGHSFGDKAYVLDAFSSSTTPTVYSDLETSMVGDTAIYDFVTAGPLKDHFTIGNSLVSGTQMQVWRLGQTEAPEIEYVVSDDTSVLRWSRDGNTLAALAGGLSSKNGIYLWKSTDRFHPRYLPRPQRNQGLTFFILAETLSWSPVDPHLLLVSDADEALIFDVRQNTPSLVLSAKVDSSTPVISKLSWSPNGRYVAGSYTPPGDNALITMKPQIFIWDIQTALKSAPSSTALQPALTFSAPQGGLAHTQSILDLSWSPDGRYLATSSFDKSVIIWKVDGP